MTSNEKSSFYLKALGHPARLQMVRELLKGQMNVGEIEKCLNIGQASTSQHLNILRNHNVVESQRKGNLKYYYLLEPGKIKKLIEILEPENK